MNDHEKRQRIIENNPGVAYQLSWNITFLSALKFPEIF